MSETPASEAPRVTPTCYRHQDRETWVSCTRCGRPICPECMRDASVGFQCPECVREGAKSVRQPVTAFGGRVASDGFSLTKVLIGLNVVAFLLQGQFDPALSGRTSSFTLRFAMLGYGVAHGEYYRLVTAAFLHGGILHIALNMWALYVVGPTLERTLGRVRFLGLYFAAAIGGNTLSYLVRGRPVLSVGASTAVFGLFGAFYIVARRMRADTSGIVMTIGINLLFTLAIPIIDKWGHIGGLLAGGAAAAIYAYVPAGPRRGLIQGAAMAGLIALMFAAAVFRTSTLPAIGP